MSNSWRARRAEDKNDSMRRTEPAQGGRRQGNSSPPPDGLNQAGLEYLISQGLSREDALFLLSRGFGNDQQREQLFAELTNRQRNNTEARPNTDRVKTEQPKDAQKKSKDKEPALKDGKEAEERKKEAAENNTPENKP
jgi:hypothetical protein